MAVKQHVTETESETIQENNTFDISTILTVIENFNNDPEKIPSGSNLVRLCEHIVKYLGLVPVPRDANSIKLFKEDINKVLNFMNYLCKGNDYNIVIACLKTLYGMITVGKEPPSGTVSMVFELVDETLIPQVVPWLANSEQASDDMIKKAVLCLCNWLRTTNFTTYLNLWIVGILNGLREQQKYDLLFDISMEVIEPLFLTIIIPLYRANAASVVILILSSIRHTPAVFHKILPRLPKVLQHLKKDVNLPQHRVVIQNFVDLITALLHEFSETGDSYKELKIALSEFTTSTDYPLSLDVPPWNKLCFGPIVNTNVRVGLVNLGNTCYMNSVLQSLVMTKQFSREILLSTIKTPLLTKVQQLLALMCYSTRPELTPRDFLHAARPPGFLPGHQQDSSEFLGYLLETLHEQERNVKNSNSELIKKRLNNDNDDNNLWNTNTRKLINNSGGGGGEEQEDSMDIDDMNQACDDKIRITKNMTDVATVNVNLPEKIEDDKKTNQQLQQLNNKIILTTSSSSKKQLRNENTLIQKTFGGKISITHKCLNCNKTSKNVDSFRDLQLSFPEFQNSDILTNDYSLQNLLDCYCAPEKLDGDNQYRCDECKLLCDGERYINIIAPPKNLILTLKHFKYDQKYHIRAKLMHKVFLDDIIYLKLNSTTTTNTGVEFNNTTTIKYCLYAAVVHSGISMDSGHYYTYASDQPNCWYKFNDSYVTKSSINDLQNLQPPNTPYILFYRKLTDNDHDNVNEHQHHNHTDNTSDDMDDDIQMIENLNHDDNNLLLHQHHHQQQQQQQQEHEEEDDNETITKKPCLINGDNTNDMTIINNTTTTATTKTTAKCILPTLDELPIYLRELITNDNVSYNEEVIGKQHHHQKIRSTNNIGRKDH